LVPDEVIDDIDLDLEVEWQNILKLLNLLYSIILNYNRKWLSNIILTVLMKMFYDVLS